MDDEARVLGSADFSVGNARSYWLDACEDISCDDFIHNFVDFGTVASASIVPESAGATSNQDDCGLRASLITEPTCATSKQDDVNLADPCFFGGIDQILDSIKNAESLSLHCGLDNCSTMVSNGHSVLDSGFTVSNVLQHNNNDNQNDAHYVIPTAANGDSVKCMQGEGRDTSNCKRNDSRYGSDHDSLNADEGYGNGNGKSTCAAEVTAEKRGRQRPLGRKRHRNCDVLDLNSCQRNQVRRREQHYASSKKDRDWSETRGYWERDREKNEMVYHLGSWEADRSADMTAVKSCQSNAGTGKKPEEQKETIKLPEEQARQYQLDVLEQAKKKNTIAFLETGAGKTLIAVLLIKSICSEMQRQSKKMLAVFLVPKVPLVYQQAEVIRERTALQVGHYCGEMGQDFWDARRWQREFETKQVVF